MVQCQSNHRMPKRSRTSGSLLAGECADSGATFDLLTHPEGRKWAALVLAHPQLGGFGFSQIAKKLKGLTRPQLSRMQKRYREAGHFEPRKRARKAIKVTEKDLDKLKLVLNSDDDGPRGQRKFRSLKKSYPRLAKLGATPACRESFRKGLLTSGWSSQPVKKALSLDAKDRVCRVKFARREHKIISANAMFTDSKYFYGEASASMKGGKAWAPTGEPAAQPTKAKAAFQVHVYGGVTRYGATPLYDTKGTKGTKSRRPGRPKKGSTPQPVPNDVISKSKSVDSVEYRRILGDGVGDGMLRDGRALFQGTKWRFQQDGASAHSCAKTMIGNPTRALIEKHASIIEPWPAKSADMSPIEKAWSAVEHDMWATEQWSDLETLIAACRRSWEKVITPQYCARLFRGIRRTYEVVIAKEGREIRGWGRGAK